MELVRWFQCNMCIWVRNRIDRSCCFCRNAAWSNYFFSALWFNRVKAYTHSGPMCIFGWLSSHVFLHCILVSCSSMYFYWNRDVWSASCIISLLLRTCRWSTFKNCCNNRNDSQRIMLWISSYLLHLGSKRCRIPNPYRTWNNCVFTYFICLSSWISKTQVRLRRLWRMLKRVKNHCSMEWS